MVNGTAMLDIDWSKIDVKMKTKTTIFFYHTKGDNMISHTRAEKSYTALQQKGITNISLSIAPEDDQEVNGHTE
jgi:predicted esterase